MIDEVRAGRLTRAAAPQALGMPLDDFLVEAGGHGLYAIDYDVDDSTRSLPFLLRCISPCHVLPGCRKIAGHSGLIRGVEGGEAEQSPRSRVPLTARRP